MRLQCKRRHHGDAAKEEDDVPAVYDRHGLVRVDLVVRPVKLAKHPQRATQRQQHPEDVAAPVWSASVQQQKSVGYQWNHALHQVPERG